MHGLDASYEDASTDFVDATVDGPSEIKLNGTDLRRPFRTAELRQDARAASSVGTTLIMPQPRADRGWGFSTDAQHAGT